MKQKEKGITRKLCCLVLDDTNAVAIGNEPVRHIDRVVGWVTSASYGYSVQKSIAYTYLPVEYAALGTRLDMEMLGERVGGMVAQDPQWDPKGERVRA